MQESSLLSEYCEIVSHQRKWVNTLDYDIKKILNIDDNDIINKVYLIPIVYPEISKDFRYRNLYEMSNECIRTLIHEEFSIEFVLEEEDKFSRSYTFKASTSNNITMTGKYYIVYDIFDIVNNKIQLCILPEKIKLADLIHKKSHNIMIQFPENYVILNKD